MFKLAIGFIVGFIVATVGVGGLANIADKGVNDAKVAVQAQAAPAAKRIPPKVPENVDPN